MSQRSVILFNLPYPYGKRQIYLPGVLIAIGAVIKEMGFQVELIDLNIEQLSDPTVSQKIREATSVGTSLVGSPTPISVNWAVQHPQKGLDGGTSYRYHEWGIPPDSPFIEAFRNFGEASIRYPLAGQKPPVIEEVQEINEVFLAYARKPLNEKP